MVKKDYILTDHARERMRTRGISEEEVETVLNDPEISYPGCQGDTNVIKTINKRRVRVTFVMEGKKKKIITAMIQA